MAISRRIASAEPEALVILPPAMALPSRPDFRVIAAYAFRLREPPPSSFFTPLFQMAFSGILDVFRRRLSGFFRRQPIDTVC